MTMHTEGGAGDRCDCGLRDRAWNPKTHRCNRCGRTIVNDGTARSMIDCWAIDDETLTKIVEQLKMCHRPAIALNNKRGDSEMDLRLMAQFFANESGKQVAVVVVPSAEDGVHVLDLDAPNTREWCRLHGVDPDRIAVPRQ